MGKDEYPGGEADSFGDRCEVAEHDEGVVERIDFGIPPGESWRSVGVHHTEHVVLGQQVVEPKVRDGDSESAAACGSPPSSVCGYTTPICIVLVSFEFVSRSGRRVSSAACHMYRPPVTSATVPVM